MRETSLPRTSSKATGASRTIPAFQPSSSAFPAWRRSGSAKRWRSWSQSSSSIPNGTWPPILCMCYELLGREEDFRRLSREHSERLLEFVGRHPDDALARGVLGNALVREGLIEA